MVLLKPDPLALQNAGVENKNGKKHRRQEMAGTEIATMLIKWQRGMPLLWKLEVVDVRQYI